MLARAIRRQLSAAGVELVGTDREVDIGEWGAVRDFMQQGRFSHVINCAAFTQVDDAETHTEQAYRVNATGPKHLAEAAAADGASLLHFSTDYVFDGQASSPYTEGAPCAPTTVYGQSKLEGERNVLATVPPTGTADRQVHIVRTSWLFGDGGNNFVATMLKLMLTRDELRVVRDQIGRPTYTEDLAAAALLINGLLRGKTAHPSGVYHFANSGVTSWWGFSNEILVAANKLGFELKARTIIPVTTQEFPRPAPRPAYSVLDTSQFEAAAGYAPRPWQTTVTEYLHILQNTSS